MRDCFGRSVNYLRVSVTDRCNLRCRYCMPEEGIAKKKHEDILRFEEIYDVVEACTRLGIDKVRLTGGDPLVRKGLADLVRLIASLGTIRDLALTTNGVLLEKYAAELKKAGLKRVNISLDTLNEEKYRHITRCGSLKDVLRGIEAAMEAGLYPIKLNTVLTGGFNEDEIKDFVNLTVDRDIDIRFIELMPIGPAAGWTRENFVSNELVLKTCSELKAEESMDKSSPARYYRLPGAKGRVGLINPMSHQFCGDCNRIRLTADGKLKPCLNSDQEIDIKAVLRDSNSTDKKEKLLETIKTAIDAKPEKHGLNEKDSKPIERAMFRIGG